MSFRMQDITDHDNRTLFYWKAGKIELILREQCRAASVRFRIQGNKTQPIFALLFLLSLLSLERVVWFGFVELRYRKMLFLLFFAPFPFSLVLLILRASGW